MVRWISPIDSLTVLPSSRVRRRASSSFSLSMRAMDLEEDAAAHGRRRVAPGLGSRLGGRHRGLRLLDRGEGHAPRTSRVSAGLMLGHGLRATPSRPTARPRSSDTSCPRPCAAGAAPRAGLVSPCSRLHQRTVGVGAAVTIELPHRSAPPRSGPGSGPRPRPRPCRGAFGQELPARIAEVALAVELADVPGRFGADAVDRAHEIAVGHRVRRLLELPEVLARGRRRSPTG